MKKDEKNINEGLNQIFEIINAKGDEGELNEIIEEYENQQLQRKQKEKR